MVRPELSIVIPFKNEESRLPATITRVLRYASRYIPNTELILVDDGSTDRSAERVKKYLKRDSVYLVSHKQNQGKGAAVRSGVKVAKGRVVLFSDADLATPIKEVRHLLTVMRKNSCDVVIASRALPESKIVTSQPWSRVMIGKFGNLIIRLVTGMPFKDTQCGFKLFTSSAAKELFSEQHFPRWSFDIEVLYRAVKKGYRICEVPVEWKDVAESKVRPIRDSLQVLIDVLRIKWRYGRKET